VNTFAPIFPRSESPAGIYVHVPFCIGRCNYCAFVTNPHDEDQEARYVGSLGREIELRSSNVPVDTIYFGGGTPSLLSSRSIGKLIAACKERYSVAEHPEITLEINPTTVKDYELVELRQMGVNRASLGVQSLDDHVLSAMGRRHSARDAIAAFEDLRSAGFGNISVDIVAGYPGQSLESLRISLDGVLALSPEHVSVYLLELKTGSRLCELIATGEAPMPDDDFAADLYEEICNILGVAGYEHYEISNFAKKGRQSVHNLKYWEDSIYIGLGSGAHGMTGRHRYANLENLDQYETAVDQNRLPYATLTELTPEARFKDALIMGMRMTRGVDFAHFGDRYRVDAKKFVMETVGDLRDADLLILDGEVLRFTPRGRLLSNLVFVRWL
jgi:putative oxygen-independent coproporphyrinogen III oxidase